MAETKKMIVHIFKTVTVDDRGELTEEGRERLESVKKIPPFKKCFVGTTFESIATARKLMGRLLQWTKNEKEDIKLIPEVGNENLVNALLDNGNEEIIKIFLDFLQARKNEGLTQILVITSPIYALIMQYIKQGGAEKLGPFKNFWNFIKEIEEWEGTRIPILSRGDYQTFKF